MNYRDHNLRLVPLMLERLYSLQGESSEDKTYINSRPFAHLGKSEGESSKLRKGIITYYCTYLD